MMSLRTSITGGLLLLVGLSCGSWPEAPASTLIEVAVLRGYPPLPSAPSAHLPVEILYDVSSSMRAQAGAGLRRFEMARLGASRLVRGLPASAHIHLSALGAQGGDCVPVLGLGESPARESRDALLAWIDSLEPGGEGSLAAALEALARGGFQRTARRVVVFTDLDEACGGDLCQAAALLGESGARLDLVVLGEAQAPACLAETAVDSAPASAPAAAPDAPRFAIWADSPPRGTPRARGRADGRPVALPDGTGVLQLDLDPPLSIGPIFFPRSTLTRIQVLDFPQLKVREWHLDSEPVDSKQEAS